MTAIRASDKPLTLAQIQKTTGYRTIALVRTSIKYLVKARALVETVAGNDITYSARNS
jgi:predicted MarR family transcription regulator